MTQTVKLPNGDTLNFPDEMPDDAIAKVISDNYPEYAPKKAAPRVLAGLPVKDPDAPDPAPVAAADRPKVLAGLPVQEDPPANADVPLDADPNAPLIADANTDPKQNQFAALRMSRADYEKQFRTINPKAPQSAVDAVMAQYDQQKADQLKAADAKRDAGPMKPILTPEQFFTERLNRRLEQHTAEVNDPEDTHHGAGIVPQLPGRQSSDQNPQPPAPAPAPASTAPEGGLDRVLDNALTSIFSQVSGAAASVGNRLGLDTTDDQAQHDKWEQYRHAAGYDSSTADKVVGMTAAMAPSMLVPGIGGTGFAAKVANASLHLGSAGVLFGLPAYDATYKSKIEQGYTPDQAKVYAAKDLIMNTAAPSLVNIGVGKVFGTAAQEVAPNLWNTAKGLAQSGAEGLGFSVANSSVEKLLDNHYGKNTDSSYVDTNDLLPSALGFMAGSSIHAGSHLLDPTVAQHFEQVAKEKAATDAANAARDNALGKWNTNGLSPAPKPGVDGRVEPTWADVTGAPPASPPPAGGRTEPSIDDIGNATTVDDAIAAANAVVNSASASPHATMAELDALEEAAGINPPDETAAPAAAAPGLTADHTDEEAQAAHDELMGAMQARALEAASQRAPLNPDQKDQIGRDTLRQLGIISNDQFGGNHPNAIDLGTADGTFAGLGTLHVDDHGNIVLRRVAHGEDHILKGEKPATVQQMMDASLFSGGAPDAGALPTSGLANFHDAYGKRSHDAIFRLKPNELIELARQGKAILGNLSEGEVLLSGDIAGRYLSEVNGKSMAQQQKAASQVDDASDWHNFPPESRTLGVPRAQMPQIRAEHRGAMVNFLNARDISHEDVQVDPAELKPTQREFSVSKVQKALEHEGGDRAILISSDNYVLDGHHQWLAAVEKGEPIRAIRLNAPIKQLVKTVHEFPSATVDTSSETTGGLGQGAQLGTTTLDPARPLSAYEASQQRIARQEEVVRQAIEKQAQHRAGQAPQEPGSSVPTAAERAPAAPIQPAAPPKPTAGQRMRERIRRDNPFLAFLATHGLHIDERSDTGGQAGRAGNVIVPGFGGSLYRKTGARIDELAQLAHEQGFLSNEDMANPADNGGTRKLADMIERAVHSKEVIQQPGLLEAAAPSVDQQLHEEAQRLGIDAEGKTTDQLYDEVAHAHRAEEAKREVSGAEHVDEQEHIDHYAEAVTPAEMHDADIPFDLNDPRLAPNHELTEGEIDALFGIQKGAGTPADRGEAEGHATEPAHEGAAPAGHPGEEGQDLLTSYTPGEVVAREDAAAAKAKAIQAERDKLELERKKAQDAKEARARADSTVDDFQLGQDAHAQLSGQKSMFDEPAAQTEKFGDRNNPGAREHNKQVDRETESWGFAPGTFDNNTHSNGLISPHFKVRDDLALPTVNNRLGDKITLGQGPNGKWGYGLDVYGDVYGPGKKGIHDTLKPDGRTQYDTRQQAIDAALARIRKEGWPEVADQLAKQAEKGMPTHQYNPERARPLLLIPCAEDKLVGTHKAIDLYKGALFNVYRKWKPTENRPDVYILSAKHGIVHADTLLEHYEQPMTKERLDALMSQPADLSLFKGKNFNEVYIAGSANYRQLGLQYAEQLRKAGFVGPDAPVDHPAQGAGIGDQRGHFADYLRKVDLRGPENAAELSDQLDAEHRARQASESKAPETASDGPNSGSEKPNSVSEHAQVDHGTDIPAEFYQSVTVPYRALGATESTDMAAHEALANTRSEIQQLEDMLKCMGG